MGRLDGKVAIITGGARGQGAAEARAFVAEGARVLLTDVLTEEGETVAASLGDAAAFRRHDVGDEDEWSGVVDEVLARWGRLDVLVNNAAIYHRLLLVDTTVAAMDESYRVNQRGVFLGMRAAVAPMRAAGGGSIVNISSAAGLRGVTHMTAYGSTKWAVTGMTKTAARELARYRIRVNSVHPGMIDTPILSGNPDAVNDALERTIPLSRRGQPEEVAAMVVYLASDESAYVTGAEMLIDGGALL